MTARAEILDTIRRALGRSEKTPVQPLPEVRLRKPPTDRAGLVEQFREKLEKLAGKVIVVPLPEDVLPAIAGILDGKSFVTSNAPFLKTCGIERSGISNREELRAACAVADAGISSVDYALAETGSFVMLSSPSEARLVSLLPPLHIAVIPKSKILANLDELLTLIPKPAEQTSSMVLITGPSRTADIEQILIRGVHGPGEVCAVIVEGS